MRVLARRCLRGEDWRSACGSSEYDRRGDGSGEGGGGGVDGPRGSGTPPQSAAQSHRSRSRVVAIASVAATAPPSRQLRQQHHRQLGGVQSAPVMRRTAGGSGCSGSRSALTAMAASRGANGRRWGCGAAAGPGHAESEEAGGAGAGAGAGAGVSEAGAGTDGNRAHAVGPGGCCPPRQRHAFELWFPGAMASFDAASNICQAPSRGRRGELESARVERHGL